MIVNSEEEKNILREGGLLLAEILNRLKEMVHPGIAADVLENEARRMIKDLKATPAFLGYTPKGAPRPYPSALCVSVNEEIVHGIPNERPKIILDGDIVTLDCGIVYEGLITDSAVSVIAGIGEKRDKELVQSVYEALMAGIDAAVVGAKIGDIGYAIEQVEKKYNVKAPNELGGHGVGRSVHEEPFVPNWGKKGKGETIVDGMVIAIEPMFSLGTREVVLRRDGYTYITKDGSKAAHAEHTILITNEGTEILTKHKNE